MSEAIFQHYNQASNWTCGLCSLPKLTAECYQQIFYADSDSSDSNNENDTWNEFDAVLQQHRFNVKIGHVNVNSVAGFKFYEIITWLLDGRFDILVISETKIDSTFPDSQFYISGFRMCRVDRTKSGGGLMVSIRSDFCFKVVNDLPNLALSERAGYRTQSIVFKVKIGKTWETFVGIYRPPTSIKVPKTVWTYELGSLLEAITSLPGNYFLLGDYNADLIAPDKPPNDGRSLLDLLDIYNLHNLISSPTRITKTSITLLDLVITNNKIKVLTSGVVHVQLSDHSLVYAFLRKTAPKKRSRKLCFRSLKHFDRELFLADLHTVPFNVMDVFEDVDDKLFVFKTLFTEESVTLTSNAEGTIPADEFEYEDVEYDIYSLKDELGIREIVESLSTLSRKVSGRQETRPSVPESGTSVAQLLQSPLSKGHQHLARKGSELQVASEFARPAVSSEGYRRSKTTSKSMVSAPRRIFCVVILAHEFALVNALLLCNDIALNPGPVKITTCAACSKSLRSKQFFAECSGCLKRYHFKCFGPELKSARLCSVCTDQSGSASDDNIDNGLFPHQGLTDIGAIKGFKIAHQNIRSIIGKIEELRLFISEVKSSFHLLTFSETWANEEIFDSELEISGYQLFRRDRGSKGGGLLVYARNDVEVVRRSDLESPTTESLWIEVCPPKSYSFLVGVLYRPPTASNHAVKDYISILESGLQQAATSGKEYDPLKFCDDLRNVDWNANENSHDETNVNNVCVDNAWTRFKAIFLQVVDRHAPFIEKRVRGRDCPWITGQIKREIRHRDFLLKKARKSKLDEDWLAYRTVRNRVLNIVRRAKQIYNKKLIKDHQKDPKTFWKTMKKILPGEKK
ncbi:hypothetical protein P5673_018760 [Acropora cervicornis]|uniref:Endonuclease/exonuclease/phosphatase domain-containing protein n=1 Tax=Acropora cervicornis TaxID=6130 RepID=A0AAD9QC87_ACRCE|nr:hypothetical protein P5673_018760 [Acropora cervicornis]